MELTARKQKILYSIVTSYIDTGEPVGSKAIAEDIGVSSATVRNEMAELIELGLLEQPHTSAGRIPSQSGYREYVDTMLEQQELSDGDKKYFDSFLISSAYDPERLMSCVSKVLALYTKYAAIATTPSGNTAKVRAVQFVQISRRTAMFILMSSAGTVKNQVFHCDFDLTTEILRVFFRVFNEKLTGMNVSDINLPFIQTLGASMGELSILAGSALVALLEVAQETMVSETLISGQMNLLFYPELEHGGISRIMGFLEKEDEIAALLKQKANRVVVLIGRESGRGELENCTVVISRYLVDGQDAGALAVLGPVRMNYSRIIAALRYVAVQVSSMLTMLMREE